MLLIAGIIIASTLIGIVSMTFSTDKTNLQSVPTYVPTESTTGQPTLTPTPTPAPTPPSQTPTPMSEAEYSAEAQRLLNQATHKIMQIRNISVPSVPLYVVSKDWAIQTWGVSSANADVAGIKVQENIYKSLLMIPQNASLYQATVDWAGYFMAVVQSGQIYLVQENFNITNTVDAEATLVHELTHISQNFYNIPRYYYSFDGDKAHAALTEGDATFTASYVKNQTLMANQPSMIFPSILQPAAYIDSTKISQFYPSIPDSVSKLNYFPYEYGEKFIQALYDNGGWETINRAYKNPPNSTEQILHPDKYFAAELPMRVAEVAPLEGNWTKTWGAQYGEFFILNMLSTNLTLSEAQKAAAGWGADKLSYYTNHQDQYLITWNTKWDTYNDSGEFFLAFNNYMRNAGAQETQFCQWQINGIYQKIVWNQEDCTNLIIATTDPHALEQFS